MKKIIGKSLVAILMLFVLLIIYTIWDNNRIKVVEQEIILENFPNQLEGFTILQVTDLHEKEFGRDQKKLIKRINSIDYDAIVFTGDMVNDTENTNYESFYTLIERLNNKDNAFYIAGNTDPYDYSVDDQLEKSDFIKGMEQRGVQLLESIETVKIDGANLHFINFELAIITDPAYIGKVNGVVNPPYANDEAYLDYQEQLWEELVSINQSNSPDIVIALNHYPLPDLRVDYMEEDPATSLGNINIDLLIAGHYHGGQIRLPFIGAIFVPDPWYEPNSFFPPKDRVKGLWEYKQIKQYVSAGLASSDAISFLNFRLFNPPEINVLKLKGD